MGKCSKFTAALQLYLVEESFGECESLLGHLDFCKTCRDLLKEARILSLRSRAARPRVFAPAALRFAVERRIRERCEAAAGPKLLTAGRSASRRQ